jgi:hypothetical protein
MVHPVFFEGLAQVKDVDLPVSVFIQLREELPQPFFIFEGELVQVVRVPRKRLLFVVRHLLAFTTLSTPTVRGNFAIFHANSTDTMPQCDFAKTAFDSCFTIFFDKCAGRHLPTPGQIARSDLPPA